MPNDDLGPDDDSGADALVSDDPASDDGPDPIDEIRSVIQHAREEDHTSTQQLLDHVSEGLAILEEREGEPRADRVASVADEPDRLADEVDDPGEAARLREARDRLRGLLDDPEHVDRAEERPDGG